VLLVAYALVELSKIYDIVERTKNWEILTDRMQVATASINRLAKITQELSSDKDISDNDQYFRYLEQSNVVYDSLFEPALHAQLPSALSEKIKGYERLLREPERENPRLLIESLNTLLPDLEYQYKLFLAQRRSNFIDSHRQIVAISIRMTVILLSGLLLSITLAVGLSYWGFHVTNTRLRKLTQSAHAVCPSKDSSMVAPQQARDELDDLAICLASMSQRVMSFIGIENVLRGAENERRRIAMDMHDGVLADLTAVNRKLKSLPSSADNSAGLASVYDDVNAVIHQLRQTIDDLHPQVLETLGLEASLRSFLQRRRVVGGLPIFQLEFAADLEQALALDQKLALFRIVCEAINNALNHSNCEKIEISVRQLAGQVIVTVEDNGIGISEGDLGDGHGFSNIKERAQLLEADAIWRQSRFSSGTCFELTMALG